MAWTNVGFDGTINEAQWASLAGLLGNDYVAAGNYDCVVTAVPGARSVSVAAGSLYGDGILSTNSAPETVAMTTPVNGQWYVIALRRTWATNTADLVAIAGATTTTTTPTAPPTSFPTLNTNVGVLTDQPIAWAWCNSANTTVVVYDIRLKAVKSLPPVVASAAERDAKFMTPWQGLQVWRNDLGAAETYYGLYNAVTNPGGRDSAGWYTDTRAMGLVPVKPTTAVFVSGSGTVNSIGKLAFSGVTSVELQGIFTSTYTSYKIIVSLNSIGSTAVDLRGRLMSGSTELATSVYQRYGVYYNQSGTGPILGGNSTFFAVVPGISSTGGVAYSSLEIYYPTASRRKNVISQSAGYSNTSTSYEGTNVSCTITEATSKDGFKIFVPAGNISGSIHVFGFNE